MVCQCVFEQEIRTAVCATLVYIFRQSKLAFASGLCAAPGFSADANCLSVHAYCEGVCFICREFFGLDVHILTDCWSCLNLQQYTHLCSGYIGAFVLWQRP